MAWNEPGGGKDNDPWGGGRNQGPPDLDDILRKLQDKFGGIFGGGRSQGGAGKPRGGIALLAVIALLAWLAYDMIYIIQPAERGVVLRFGKYIATLHPGPNVRFPRPIETVEKVNVDQVRTIEIGYRSIQGQRASTVPSEALMLTQDENIVDLRVAVQYRVENPRDYLFDVRDPDATLKQISESALREVVGKHEMDFVLKEGRAEIVARTQSLMQEIADRYGTGLHVTSVNLVDAQPPEEVQGAFLDAIKAREDQQRIINEGEAYANDVLPKARGAAARSIEDSRAYRAKKIANAEGDADRFSEILTEYEKAPEITRKRLYLETMQDVLSNTSKVLLDIKGSNNVVYLPLDRILQERKAAQSGAGKTDTSQDGSTAQQPTQSTGSSADQQSQSQGFRERSSDSAFQSSRERESR
jgi:membrane protease subunit HflK